MNILSKDEFEQKCIEIMEEIILMDKKQTRAKAVELSKKMLENAKADPKYKKEVIDIFARVVEEFEEATDEDYDILRNQLFN